MKADYQVKAALPEQEELFYSDSSREENCIGHLRGDFGHGGTNSGRLGGLMRQSKRNRPISGRSSISW